jgi:ABC-type nickel/cobalt efflux system permease component RcnA
MKSIRRASIRPRITSSLILAVFLIIGFAGAAIAHPLGNFTINHFARLEVGDERINVRFVVDMAEIPTLQEMQTMNAAADGSPSSAELDAYLARVSTGYADGLRLTIDGKRIPLQIVARRIATLSGDSGLPTLRVECDFTGTIPAGSKAAARNLKFEDTIHPDRIGWHEIVVAPADGISVFNTYAFADGISDELRTYPEDLTIAPLNERIAELQFTQGDAPAGASGLRTRGRLADASDRRNTDASRANAATGAQENGAATKARDRFAELLDVKELTLPAALLGLLIAAFLGAAHSFSPGHGKTVVGAYLVGSRGTWRHAVFLGATVTITHTLGVFALGFVTLFASQYIVPERLIPILSFVSGAIVLLIGLSLFIKRLRSVLGIESAFHTHDGHAHAHEDVHARNQDHDGINPALMHSHGGGVAHSHLPPGADGVPVTWRSLLGLGISGGLVPCPSALVVLLSAITLNRTGYGLLLVTSFSLGLAATLTVIGLVFVYAGQWMKERAGVERFQTWGRVLPTFSAFVIVCVGAILCFEALTQAGMVTFSASRLSELFTSSVSSAGTLSTCINSLFRIRLGTQTRGRSRPSRGGHGDCQRTEKPAQFVAHRRAVGHRSYHLAVRRRRGRDSASRRNQRARGADARIRRRHHARRARRQCPQQNRQEQIHSAPPRTRRPHAHSSAPTRRHARTRFKHASRLPHRQASAHHRHDSRIGGKRGVDAAHTFDHLHAAHRIHLHHHFRHRLNRRHDLDEHAGRIAVEFDGE